MSSTIFVTDRVLPEGRGERTGFFSRLSRAVMHSRLQQAKREVNLYLSRLDDDELEQLGYRRSEISRDVASHYRL
ncbi:hypothetical protein [Afifella sp. IM 167]|uniref:hypothetical protein n=1 Tax=Afifella sp. IM 167 TaxID=2033586 RepID=UPI001CCF1B1E|nr:hypothetical protein [Afifella sp. IM 167]